MQESESLFDMVLDQVVPPLERKPKRSKLDECKAEALRVAGEKFPAADEIRLCLVAEELVAEVWKDGRAQLWHTDVFTRG